MSIDARLDLNFIKDKLLEIFIQNKKLGDNYIASIINEGNDLYDGIIISNNNINCCHLQKPELINDKYIIYIGSIHKCNENKSGTTNLNNIIFFGKKYNYDIIELYNLSEFIFNINDGSAPIKLDTTKLKLLTNKKLKNNLDLTIIDLLSELKL